MENYRLTQTGEEVQDILNGAAMQTDLTAENERAEGAEQTLQGNIDEVRNAIDGINAKIPAAASSENKLADQDFVNSSIETATATFRGTFNLVSDLHLAVDATHAQIATLLGTVIAEADKNDYSYVLIPTSAQTPTEIASIEKYTFGANGWAFAYALNNSGFTSAQWAAINSGITSGLVAKLNALPTNTDLLALLAGKQDVLTFDDVPVEGSNNPVKSGGVHSAIDDEKTARVNAMNALAGRVDTIEGEIPAQASSENQLADKDYVNSSISTNTATYRGSFNLVADLGLSVSATHEQIGTALAGEISTADNNDYAYVQVPTSDETPSQILKVERYKFNGTAWAFEYELNNSGFTSAQWAAINSGITSGLVGKLNALPTNDELTLALAGKQDVLTFDNTPTENSNNPVKSGGVYAADKALSDAIEAILLLIPSAATSLNKLVDTDLMNSSISTATATFRGTFNLVSDLSLDLTATHAQIATALAGAIATADNNDYAFVQVPTAVGTPTEIAQTDRYKFNGTAWAYEYTLNTSGFTSAQWAAINSGITAALVASLADIPDLIPSEATSANQLADKAYVLAQILAATPAFKGQFTTLAELQAVASPKAGDLGIVRTKDSDGMDVFTVYQYLNNAWNVFYSLSYHPQTKPATTGTTGDYPYNGMGRVELAMNMVNTGTDLEPVMVNQLTQDMFYKGAVGSRVPNTNTIFVIQYDYELAENITIPSGCVLQFDGGSIGGGVIDFNSCVIAANSNDFIFKNLTNFSNLEKCSIKWFGAKGDGVTDDTNVFRFVCNRNHYVENTTKMLVVNVPFGVYVITSCINPNAYSGGDDYSKFYLKGEEGIPISPYDTITALGKINRALLYCKGNYDEAPFIYASNLMEHISFRGEDYVYKSGYLGFLNKYDNTIGISISAENAYAIERRLSDIQVLFFGTGIVEKDSFGGNWNNVQVSACGYGVKIIPENNNITFQTITHLEISKCKYDCLLIDTNKRCRIVFQELIAQHADALYDAETSVTEYYNIRCNSDLMIDGGYSELAETKSNDGISIKLTQEDRNNFINNFYFGAAVYDFQTEVIIINAYRATNSTINFHNKRSYLQNASLYNITEYDNTILHNVALQISHKVLEKQFISSDNYSQRPSVAVGEPIFDKDAKTHIIYNGEYWSTLDGINVSGRQFKLRGTTEERKGLTLGSNQKGLRFFDEDLNKWVLFNGSRWVNLDGVYSAGLTKGTSAQRPVFRDYSGQPASNKGYIYFDETLSKNITFNGETWEYFDGTPATYELVAGLRNVSISSYMQPNAGAESYSCVLTPAEGYSITIDNISVSISGDGSLQPAWGEYTFNSSTGELVIYGKRLSMNPDTYKGITGNVTIICRLE